MSNFEPYVILDIDAGRRCYKRGDPEVREFDGETFSFIDGINDIQMPGARVSLGKSASLGSGSCSVTLINDELTPGALLTTYARVQAGRMRVYVVAENRSSLIFDGEVDSILHNVDEASVTLKGGPVARNIFVPFPAATTLEEGRLVTRETRQVSFSNVYRTITRVSNQNTPYWWQPPVAKQRTSTVTPVPGIQETATFIWLKDKIEFKTLFGTPSKPQYPYQATPSAGQQVEFVPTQIQQLDGSEEYGNITDPGTFLWWETSAKDEPIPVVYGRNRNVSLKPFAHYRVTYHTTDVQTAVLPSNQFVIQDDRATPPGGTSANLGVKITVTNFPHPATGAYVNIARTTQNGQQRVEIKVSVGSRAVDAVSVADLDAFFNEESFHGLPTSHIQLGNTSEAMPSTMSIRVRGGQDRDADVVSSPSAAGNFQTLTGVKQYAKIYIYPVASQRIIGDDRLVGQDPTTIRAAAQGFAFDPDFFLALRWGDNQYAPDFLSGSVSSFEGGQLGYIDNDGKDGTISYVTLAVPYKAPTTDENGNPEIEEFTEILDSFGVYGQYKGFTPQGVYALMVKGKQKQGAEPIASLGDVINDVWSTFGAGLGDSVDWNYSALSTSKLNQYQCDMVVNKSSGKQTLARVLNSRLSGQFPVAFGFPRGKLAWQCTSIPLMPPKSVRSIAFGKELIERVSISETPKKDVQNVVDVQFGVDGARNGTRFTTSINPENNNIARASMSRWGRSRANTIQLADSQDDVTASMIGQEFITLNGGIRITCEYLTEDMSFITTPPLTVFSITDPDAAFSEEDFYFLGYNWGTDLASLSVSFLSVEMV